MPESKAEIAACTGDVDCPARLHEHGCYADEDGAACDDPEDHPCGSVHPESGARCHLDPHADDTPHNAWTHWPGQLVSWSSDVTLPPGPQVGGEPS